MRSAGRRAVPPLLGQMCSVASRFSMQHKARRHEDQRAMLPFQAVIERSKITQCVNCVH